MDKYRIDSHKLLYHPDRVGDWKAGKNVYPVYIEASPAGACNHRCRFCAKDFIGYKSRNLKWDIFKDRLEEMGRLGVRSIMHAGEGEPLLHKNIVDIVRTGKANGISQAINTNGVLLTEELAEELLPHLEWMRFSTDAATAETHAEIHVTHPRDFEKLVTNVRKAVEIRDRNKYECALGMQMVLLPENRHETKQLAALARDLGVDYLSIKPYSQNPHGNQHHYEDINYKNDVHMAEELKEFNTHKFNVVFRTHAMQKWDDQERTYHRCSAMAFWTYLDAAASLWGCCNHHSDERFYLGNLYENTFEEIWNGEKRLSMMDWATNDFDISHCRINCRMDEVNRYLWDVKHPPAHANFI